MSQQLHNVRNRRHYKKRKLKMDKKISYITTPKKANKKRMYRQKVRDKRTRVEPMRSLETLKFGSFNVDGLDTEAGYVINDLLETKNFDVCRNKTNHNI